MVDRYSIFRLESSPNFPTLIDLSCAPFMTRIPDSDSRSLRLTRVSVRKDPRLVPPWDFIANFLAVNSEHIGTVTRITENGVGGVIESREHVFPFFVDMTSLEIVSNPIAVGDSVALRVVAQDETRHVIKFIPIASAHDR